MSVLQWGKEYNNFKELEKDIVPIKRNPFKLYYQTKENVWVVGMYLSSDKYGNGLDNESDPKYWYEDGQFDDYDKNKDDEIDLLFIGIENKGKTKFRFVGCFKLKERTKMANRQEKRIWEKISDTYNY